MCNTLAFVIMALVVTGEAIMHRSVSDTNYPEASQPNLERGKSTTTVKGGPRSGHGLTSFPVDITRLLEAIPPLGTSDEKIEQRLEQRKGKREIPPCYSSAEANPSKGYWRKAKGGVDESPVTTGDWAFPRGHFNNYGRCTRIWGQEHRGHQSTQPYWVWKPFHCTLKAVSAAGFCRVMKGRKGVLFVGDSLSRLSTTTLASILRAKPVRLDLMGDEWSACGNKLTVRFMRNDYLDVRTSHFDTENCEHENGEREARSRCSVFADSDTLKQFDTLVVNSGAHPRPGKVYGPAMSIVSETLAASMKSLHGDDAILIVRNTVPGHWGCTERIFDGPTNSSIATDLVNSAPDTYEWHNFRDNNALLNEAFSHEQGWRLLDAFSPTLLRSDSHIGGKDCLHYCLPGPADHWIVLLYNMLLDSLSQR